MTERRRRRTPAALLALAGALLALTSMAQQGGGEDGGETPAPVMLLEVDGAIGPATTDYLTRAFDDAAEGGYAMVVLRMDTPGGLTAATRDIVQAIRRSPVPVATWVAPEGARAASAGTYILYASHVAAMAPATNVGAATPVPVGGGGGPGGSPGGEPADAPAGEGGDGGGAEGTDEAPSDSADGEGGGSQPADASSSKAVNDAAAWIRSLAQETGRNADWAERAVREAVSLTAEEAVEKNVADFLATSITDLLEQADGRVVKVAGQESTLEVAGAAIERRAPDWRSELLAVITNPTVAYLLMMIGIYGLLLEGYNPGSLVPGTVGAICLLLALYAFQVLPVNYAGLLLMLLGIILIVAEAFVPSFGALGLGGVISMVAGSIILMDTDVPGFQVALEVIGGTALFASLLTAAIVTLAVRAWRRPVVSGSEGVTDAIGEAVDAIGPGGGAVHLQGERWNARSTVPIAPGQRVRVIRREGLVLEVEPESERKE
jgi:membrane-bound serine protease (ClpP class)